MVDRSDTGWGGFHIMIDANGILHELPEAGSFPPQAFESREKGYPLVTFFSHRDQWSVGYLKGGAYDPGPVTDRAAAEEWLRSVLLAGNAAGGAAISGI